jgi:putative FmdB family regulatory protein
VPTYGYRCSNGHTFEVVQRMADDPIRVCEVCGEPVERVFYPVAVHFKGSGFYATDYGRARGGGGADSASKEGSKDGSKDSASKETATSKADSSKTDSSAGMSSSSGSSDSGSSGSSSESGSSAKSD